MRFRIPRTRRSRVQKSKKRLPPFGSHDTFCRLDQVNDALLTNHYWEQRSYIAAINLQYAINALPVLPEEKIRVHFIYLDANRWPLWDGLYQACVADDRLNTKVIYLDARQSPQEETLPPDAVFLREKGITYTSYADYDPYEECPHLLIYQSPLDEVYQRFSRLKAGLVKKRGIRPVCFCVPEYDTPEADECRILYQQDAHMFAWRIVAPRREIREEFYRHCLSGGDAVLVVEGMDGEGIRDGLLAALYEERERLARAPERMGLAEKASSFYCGVGFHQNHGGDA